MSHTSSHIPDESAPSTARFHPMKSGTDYIHPPDSGSLPHYPDNEHTLLFPDTPPKSIPCPFPLT